MEVYKALKDTLRNFTENSVETGVADATSTVNFLDDTSKDWPVNIFSSPQKFVKITEGTGVGQVRKISANTATRITPVAVFTTAPDVTSKYRVGSLGNVVAVVTSADITKWGGTTLTGRDISLDLAKIPPLTASGNAPVSIEEAGIQVPTDIQSQYKPLLDSTTTALGGSLTYTGSPVNVSRYARLTGIIYADKACVLHIDHSGDGSNWDYSSEFAVVASTGAGYTFESITGHARLRIVNGAAAQSILRAYLYGRVI